MLKWNLITTKFRKILLKSKSQGTLALSISLSAVTSFSVSAKK